MCLSRCLLYPLNLKKNIDRLEKLKEQANSVNTVAVAMRSGQPVRVPNFDSNNPMFDPFDDLPAGSMVQRHKMRRVAYLPDGSVFGETTPETFLYSVGVLVCH